VGPTSSMSSVSSATDDDPRSIGVTNGLVTYRYTSKRLSFCDRRKYARGERKY
jgi:hypothetical protein